MGPAQPATQEQTPDAYIYLFFIPE